eukprot:SAG11_NODE_717_length_7606_cov_5.968563_2_plen_131_part_00
MYFAACHAHCLPLFTVPLPDYAWLRLAPTPHRVVVALLQLGFLMGWAAAAGTVVLVVTLNINMRLTKKLASLRREQLADTDLRVRLTNEALLGMAHLLPLCASSGWLAGWPPLADRWPREFCANIFCART